MVQVALVVQNGDRAHADPAEDQGPAAVQGLQGRRHQFSCRRKDDRSIQADGRPVRYPSGPDCAQFLGQLPVALPPREHVNLDFHVTRYLYSNVGRGSEPVKPQAHAGPYPGKFQGPVPDDAGAQKGRGLKVVKILGEMIREFLRGADDL